MEEKNSDWTEDIITSMQGAQKAEPSPALFARIEQEVELLDAKVIPMSYVRLAAACIVIILFLNGISLVQHLKTEIEFETAEVNQEPPLFHSFQIYE